jgi:hypothetical protein
VFAIVAAPCDAAAGRVPATDALYDPVLYRDLLRAFSMRDFVPGAQSGEDHFFDTFMKFDAAARGHTGELLAEVVSRAGHQNESYLELTLNLDLGQATALGAKLGWDEDLDRFCQKLAANGLQQIVAAGRAWLDKSEATMRQLLACGSDHADAGCSVTVRYIFEVYRGLPREQVFAQMVDGFELAKQEQRVVSVNPVMPEDAYVPMHDFDLHMRMFAYLHKLYPQVRLTMHAGELTPGQVPPEGLRDHIRKTVEVAGAERIGHGADVMWEDDPFGLMREMAQKKIAVEICLTSNDLILGLRGPRHPFPIYMQHGVPVVIATDDEGVSRSDMTREYERAVETYGLRYFDLKRLARNSLEYSFASAADKSRLLRELDRSFVMFERQHAR